MRRLFQGFVAAAVMATGMAAIAPTPSMAQSLSIEIGSGDGRNPAFERCRAAHCGTIHQQRRWMREHGRWNDRRDHRLEREHRELPRVGRVSRESVARCAQRYRSYDPRTHTYVVNRFGDRAVCRL